MSEHPNILTVGDDDQSIYRFQGANLENMLHFSQKYPETAIIVLSQNYRSGQAILDTASELISHNTTRLSRLIPSITKPLQSIRKAPVPPRIIGYADAATEKALVLERIQEQLAQGTPPEEIAVIVRINAEVYAWSQMLESA
jgi:DNA helicase-2/ATP-dependent DNA helicase PcrA